MPECRQAPAVIAAMVLPILLVTGCARWPERTHARYEVGAPAKLRPAADGGLYGVKWSATPDGQRQPVRDAQRVIGQGATIGFAPDDAGRVLAVAGDERFVLDGLPEQARYCFWATRAPVQPGSDEAGGGAALAEQRVGDALRAIAGLGMLVAFHSLDGLVDACSSNRPSAHAARRHGR